MSLSSPDRTCELRGAPPIPFQARYKLRLQPVTVPTPELFTATDRDMDPSIAEIMTRIATGLPRGWDSWFAMYETIAVHVRMSDGGASGASMTLETFTAELTAARDGVLSLLPLASTGGWVHGSTAAFNTYGTALFVRVAGVLNPSDTGCEILYRAGVRR